MFVISRLRRTAICAGVFVLPFSAAMADPVYNVTIGLAGITFSDGTILSGQFSLNIYGYFNSSWDFTTAAGSALDSTPIAAYDFNAGNGGGNTNGGPATYQLSLNSPSDDVTLYLTFAHALTIPGIDPLLLDTGFAASPLSGECAGYSCTAGNERLVTGGSAVVMAEPVSSGILGAGLLGLLTLRRRRKG
jgi:MYXO-CTERM domain-containing protein